MYQFDTQVVHWMGLLPIPSQDHLLTSRSIATEDTSRISAANGEVHVRRGLRILRIKIVVLIEDRFDTPEECHPMSDVRPNEPRMSTGEIVIHLDPFRQCICSLQHVDIVVGCVALQGRFKNPIRIEPLIPGYMQ